MAIVAVQVILWTDLPRRWVLDSLSGQLGMTLDANDFATGWRGRTRLGDVTLTLPLEEQPVLRIDQVRIAHNSLPGLLVGRPITLDRLEVGGVIVDARQDRLGQWNVQRAALLVQHAIAADGAPDETSAPVALPTITLDNLVVNVIESGNTRQIGPLTFAGQGQGPLAWTFQLDAPAQGHLNGSLAMGPDTFHRLSFALRASDAFAHDWLPPQYRPAMIDAQWQGQFTAGQLSGRLQLTNAQLGKIHAVGKVQLTVGGENTLLVHPEPLQLKGLHDRLDCVELTQGRLCFTDNQLTVGQLGFVLPELALTGQINGLCELDTRQATFTGSWAARPADNTISHQGTWQLALDDASVGPKHLKLDLNTTGRQGQNRWQSHLLLSGSGDTWKTSSWQLALPELAWRSPDQPLVFDGSRAELAVDWPQIKLIQLAVPPISQLDVQALAQADTKTWKLQIRGQDITLPPLVEGPISLALAAQGTPDQIQLTQLDLHRQNLTLAAHGAMTLPDSRLVDTHVSLEQQFPTTHVDQQPPPAELTGNLLLTGRVDGTVRPLELTMKGRAATDQFLAHQRALPDIHADWQARLDDKRFAATAEPFYVFDGLWQFHGEYDLAERTPRITLDVQNLSLRAIEGVIATPSQWQGLFNATVDMTIPALDLKQTSATGRWASANLAVPPFHAHQAHGDISAGRGHLEISNIHFQQGHGSLTGRMNAPLDNLNTWNANFLFDNWPTQLDEPNLLLCTAGEADITVDLTTRHVNGTVDLQTDATLEGKHLATTACNATCHHQTIDITSLHVEALAGRAEGVAQVALDDWTKSTAQLAWQDMEPAQLTAWWPDLQGLAGPANGTLQLTPADNTNALEPLMLQIQLESNHLSFRHVPVRGAEVLAYAGPQRLVVEEACLDVAEGTAKAYASFTREPNNLLMTYLRTELYEIDLNQVAHLIAPNAKATPGLLSGTARYILPDSPKRASGYASVTIDQCDLMPNTIISTLFQLLNRQKDQLAPKGKAHLKLHAEGPRLYLDSFRYLNQGVEVRGALTITDLLRAERSPIQGYAMASLAPLQGVKIPGVKELDRLMASLQEGVASVRISGTLKEPKATPVPLIDVSRPLRRLLWRQLREE